VTLSRRAYWKPSQATDWKALWDASEYFDSAAELLEDAQHWVFIVGWQLDSRLLLRWPERPGAVATSRFETLKAKVLRLCEKTPDLRFYLLLWDHPSFYIPQREWLQTRVWEELHPRVHLVFDSRHPFGASHHEKLILVDGQTAITGGVDLCADRWDTPQHRRSDPRRSLDRKQEAYGPYHELGVRLSGPTCSLLLQHCARRWRKVSSIPAPELRPHQTPKPDSTLVSGLAQSSESRLVWISRTRSSIDPDEPQRPLIREIEFLFRDLILSAKHEIWLEGQYFWSKQVAQALLQKISSARQELRITLILADLSHLRFLPARMAWFQANLLAQLQRAAQSFPHVHFEVYRPTSGPRAIYVHSKLLFVDDRFVSIGSANFSARALRLDSELMLTFEARNSQEQAEIKRFGQCLKNHWSSSTLNRVDAIAEEAAHSRRAPLLGKIPWQKAIDPEIPYFYRCKRRMLSKLRRPKTRTIAKRLSWSASWTGGFLGVLFLARATAPQGSLTAWVLAALLYSVWMAPIPFLAIFLATSLLLDPNLSSRITISSWWMAILLSTLWGRSFPSSVVRRFERFQLRKLQGFGQRHFARTLRLWFDPRFSTYEKVLSQTHYWTPLPWIVLIHGLIVPSFLVWLIRAFRETILP
jgi:phosphatidylserine/phosphatidylglycerophosphate/cardiolipin synthase-like enzyme